MHLFINILFLLYLIVTVNSDTENVTVLTSRGEVIGSRNEGYDMYLGVPYAKVNRHNPFGKSTAYPNFTTPFIADNSTIKCPQLDGGVIDCLILNIYVPHGEHKKLSVLVWFHGDSLSTGKGEDYHSSYLLAQEIIIVTVNFRLGPYGFLCIKQPSLPGNQALRDQVEALRWIQADIGAFGGDPNSVTIGGSGYGGSYVDLHLYSNAETLFSKAIIQSGSLYLKGFYVKADSRAALILAKHFGKEIGKRTKQLDVMPFLGDQDPIKIMKASTYLNLTFGVCKEYYTGRQNKNFVTRGPFNLDHVDKARLTKILIGYNSMELLNEFAKNNTPEFYHDAGDIIYENLKDHFSLNHEQLTELSDIVKKFYIGDDGYGPHSMVKLSELISDFYVLNPVERSVDRLDKAGSTMFKYLFSYVGASQYKTNISELGAPKGEEMKFLFDMETPLEGEEQESIRTTMVELWSNFIKFGIPTPTDDPVSWTPIEGSNRPYLNIDVNITVGKHLHQARNAFWDLVWHAHKKRYPLYW